MSHGYASRQQHRGGGTSPTVLGAKVVVALAAAASLARLAVPRLVTVAGAVFPRLWAVARFWLAPPYLFVTVHLIILVIWKLSDHKHSSSQAQAQAHHLVKDPWPAAAHPHTAHPAPEADAAVPSVDVAARAKVDFGAAGGYGASPLVPEALPVFSPDSGGSDSCVTTESDEDASSAASSYLVEARRSVAPARLEREPSLLPQDIDRDGDDDLDATWNAIMKKTRPAAAVAPARAPPSPAAQPSPRPPPRARDPSVGADEMNRRFDDFIKKNRHSFRLQ